MGKAVVGRRAASLTTYMRRASFYWENVALQALPVSLFRLLLQCQLSMRIHYLLPVQSDWTTVPPIIPFFWRNNLPRLRPFLLAKVEKNTKSGH